MNNVNILTYADGSYIQHVCVLLLSLAKNNTSDRKYKVFIYYSNCTDIQIKKIQKSLSQYLTSNISYEIIECVFNLELNSKMDYLNPSIYDKLLIYEKLPQEIEKVLFLDADIILLKDPALLFDSDIEDYILAAVKDQIFRSFNNQEKYVLEISENDYFNSGVMLVNLKRWRDLNISQRSLEFAVENWNSTPYHDQDAFNYIVGGRWLEISPLWNPRIDNYIIDENGKETNYKKMEVYNKNLSFLIHFSGPSKPWLYMSFHPRKKLYLAYLRKSEFRDYSFPDLNFKNFVKKQFLNIRRKLYFFRTTK